jgi:hypothetical protein
MYIYLKVRNMALHRADDPQDYNDHSGSGSRRRLPVTLNDLLTSGINSIETK